MVTDATTLGRSLLFAVAHLLIAVIQQQVAI
jgi:hypothetical protein